MGPLPKRKLVLTNFLHFQMRNMFVSGITGSPWSSPENHRPTISPHLFHFLNFNLFHETAERAESGGPWEANHTKSMEEIRNNHLRFFKTLVNNGSFLHINWLAGFLNHQQYQINLVTKRIYQKNIIPRNKGFNPQLTSLSRNGDEIFSKEASSKNAYLTKTPNWLYPL